MVLQSCLSRSLDSSVYDRAGEPAPDGWLAKTCRDDLPDIERTVLDDFVEGHSAAWVLRRLGSEIAKREGRSAWVEKSPDTVGEISRVKELFSDAVVVVLIRDAAGFLLSYKSQGLQLAAAERARFVRRYHPIGGMLVWRKAVRQGVAAARRWPDSVAVFNMSEPGEDLRALSFLDRKLGNEAAAGGSVASLGKVNSSSALASKNQVRLDLGDWLFLWLFSRGDLARYRGTLGDRRGGMWRIIVAVLSIPRWVVVCWLDLRATNRAPLRRVLGLVFDGWFERRGRAS